MTRLRLRSQFFFGWLLLLLVAVTGRAQEAPPEIALVTGETSIAPGATRRFEFGTVPQQGTIVTLEVTSRLQSKTPLGSSFFMKVALNGNEIKPARGRTAQRLVNKPLSSPVTPSLSALWFGAPKGWRVLYAPDFEVARQQPFYQGDPYTLIWDVTDLINPAAENRLDITNTADANAIRASGSTADLILGKLVVHNRAGQSPMMTPMDESAAFINRGEPGGDAAAYEGDLSAGGGFSVTVGHRRWQFDSAFSYPNAGFNRLVSSAAADKGGQPNWKVHVISGKNGGEVQAEGAQYSVKREVRFEPGIVRVQDAITNRTNEPLGLMVRHQTRLDGLENPRVYIAGNPDPGVNDYYSPGNPSVVIQAADHMVGFLCEDDVFRNQARLYVDSEPVNPAPLAGIRTEMLRLAPHETYSLKWSVHLVRGRDYFDFINAVRKDWGANFTALGAWYWGFYPDEILQKPDAELRAQFERQGIRYVSCGGGWVDYSKDKKRIGFGSGVLDPYWDDFRGRLRDAAAKMRRVVPGVKVLAYYDSQRDTSENAAEKLLGGNLTNPDGSPHFTDWSNLYQRTYSGVATLNNEFGRAMLTTTDRYMDEMKLDGLYWDEMENTFFGAPLLTYNMADGHTCLLDPKTYTIKREVGLTTLLGEAHRLEVIRRVQAKGGMLLGNGPTTTRDLLATGIQRMTESQHNDYLTAEGLLQTPLGYMSRRATFADFRRVVGLGVLPVGTQTTYTHEFSRYLFPFTPIELHSGYLLGEERIVVTHSGNYGWQGGRNLVSSHHFNSEGKVSGRRFASVIGTEAKTRLELGNEEAAVLEKLPVTVQSRGEVTAETVRYDASGIEVRLTAPKETIIQIRSGIFAVADKQRFRVEQGNKSETVVALSGVLTIKLLASFDGIVRVKTD